MGGAYGGVQSPIGANQEEIRLGSLDFFNHHTFNHVWANFRAFIIICTILTYNCATGLDYYFKAAFKFAKICVF